MFVSLLYMNQDFKIILLPAWTTVCSKDILLDVGFCFLCPYFLCVA